MGDIGTATVHANTDGLARAIFEHASRLVKPIDTGDASGDFNGTPVMVVPYQWKVEPIPGWEPAVPHRVKQTVEVTDVASFAKYWEEYAYAASNLSGPQSVIFAEVRPDGLKVVGVLDYHRLSLTVGARTEAAWGSHRVVYEPALSEDWKAWKAIDKKHMSQMELAQFLEDNLQSCVEPAGADLLEMINTLAVDETITFRSAQRLQSGAVRFSYDNDSKARSGEVEMPSVLKVELPVFRGSKTFTVAFRLKYRLVNGSFKLWLEMVRAAELLAFAAEAELGEIAKQTQWTIIRGKLL